MRCGVYVLLCIDLGASLVLYLFIGFFNFMIIMISSIYLTAFFHNLFPLFPPLDDEILAIDEGNSQ